jgi:hypothetical protein
MKQKFGTEDPKIEKEYDCELCNYKCCKLSLYKRHIITDKHKKRANETKEVPSVLVCNCGKKFNSRTTIWRHKKKCHGNVDKPFIEELPKEDTADLHHLFLETLKQNQELQKQVIELAKYFIKNNN